MVSLNTIKGLYKVLHENFNYYLNSEAIVIVIFRHLVEFFVPLRRFQLF